MPASVPPPAPWMSRVLIAAGIYNILWGCFAILAPVASLRLAALPSDVAAHPGWQGLGLILGLYGVGYWIAARDPYRHWVIIFVGLLGKVLNPLAFLTSVVQGILPAQGLWMLLPNDLIWWLPFTVILWQAAVWHDAQTASASSGSALRTLIGSTGQTLAQLSDGQRVLVVFLRHSGCTFCREALDDLSKVRSQIEASGAKIALVHMSPEADIAPFVEKYHVADLPRFCDSQRQLYIEFDLQPGGFTQLFGWKVWWRGMLAAFGDGHGFGSSGESMFQMPGTFLIENGQVLRAFRHQSPADRPDYAELACSIPPSL